MNIDLFFVLIILFQLLRIVFRVLFSDYNNNNNNNSGSHNVSVSIEKSFYPQETIGSNQQSYTARELRSGTDYLITVIAQYPNSLGESVSGKARTSENWTQQKYVSSKLASLKKLSLSLTPI